MSRRDKYISLRYPEASQALVEAYRKKIYAETGTFPGVTETILTMINDAAVAAVQEARAS